MTATGDRVHSANEWRAMLAQVENTIDRSLRDVKRHEALVAEEPATSSDRMNRVQSRLDERIRKLSERVVDAERTAETASAELAAAEAELRQWVEQIGGIAKRIDVMSH